MSLEGKAQPGKPEALELPEDFEGHSCAEESAVKKLAGSAPIKINFKLILIIELIGALLLLSIFVKYATFFMVRKLRKQQV